jgi:hypothetical protein
MTKIVKKMMKQVPGMTDRFPQLQTITDYIGMAILKGKINTVKL